MERIKEIDNEVYTNIRDSLKLYQNQNSQILHSWFTLALKLKKTDVLPHIELFLSKTGKLDDILDLYKEYYLINKFEALRIFQKNKYIISNYRSFYHPIVLKAIENEFLKIENI